LLEAELRPFYRLIVWDNSRRENRRVYGRYLGAQEAETEFVYVQDDDCLVDVKLLCEMYEPGELLCNVLKSHQPHYQDGITLVGWGSIFPRSLIDFSPYLDQYPEDELFDRECDRIFTYLNRDVTRVVDIGLAHMSKAFGGDRMGREARHGDDLREVRKRLYNLDRMARKPA
jgi:hypothetical protein